MALWNDHTLEGSFIMYFPKVELEKTAFLQSEIRDSSAKGF